MYRLKIHAARRGLTLIELVVVIAILAVLAGLVIPRLDFLKAQADHAAAAATTGDVMSMIQTYKTSSGSYPTLDLLTDGTSVTPTFWSIDGATVPFTATTLPEYTGAPGTYPWYRSFLDGGLKSAFQQMASASITDMSNSTTSNSIDLVDGVAAGSAVVAEVSPTAVSGFNEPYLTSLMKRLYPTTAGVVPTDRKLIGLGVGPNNSMVGTVMLAAPLEKADDDSTQIYSRYIALFEIFQNGAPAKLKAVVDHRFKQVDAHITQFQQSAAN